jgi:2-polyprenyl-6-hydroxyphenyl methylase/3-demethylubiquinone-9 3-methyltransferase
LASVLDGRPVPREIYERIDNGLYDAVGEQWWDPVSSYHQTLAFLNPVRIGFAKKVLLGKLGIDPGGKKALEVGCGGGILCEEIARLGFETTGIDPSEASLRAAIEHARAGGLSIRYGPASGESLPFADSTFDVVFCCDVLEHVRDLPKVISEVSRVLKPGGAFCYDTFNRTWVSRLAAIKIAQEWKRWAFMPPRLHVFEMFVKPREMKSLLRRNGLEWRMHRGTKLNVSVFQALGLLRRRAKGELTYKDLGERLRLVESGLLAVLFLGCAVKR